MSNHHTQGAVPHIFVHMMFVPVQPPVIQRIHRVSKMPDQLKILIKTFPDLFFGKCLIKNLNFCQKSKFWLRSNPFLLTN